MKNEEMCRIPVIATMRKINGEYVMVDAEYADIPASAIAEFLIRKFGITPILKGADNENDT